MLINSPFEEFDLYSYFINLVKQIPEGKVTSYREMATALGDRVSAVACAYMQSALRGQDDIPLHRLVRASGELGGYNSPDEIRENSRILRGEGITVTSGRVKFMESHLFSDFDTDYPLEKMREEQERMSERLSLEDDYDEDILGAVDVSYDALKGYAHFVYEEDGEYIGSDAVMDANFPYIPGYLFYREYRFVKSLARNFPGTLLIDGNGIIHPRFFGLASETGVCLNKATVGIAKSLLLGNIKQNLIVYRGREIGYMLNSGTIISPGHRISLESSIGLIKEKYNHAYPDLMKVAHNNTVRLRRNEAQLKEAV